MIDNDFIRFMNNLCMTNNDYTVISKYYSIVVAIKTI